MYTDIASSSRLDLARKPHAPDPSEFSDRLLEVQYQDKLEYEPGLGSAHDNDVIVVQRFPPALPLFSNGLTFDQRSTDAPAVYNNMSVALAVDQAMLTRDIEDIAQFQKIQIVVGN